MYLEDQIYHYNNQIGQSLAMLEECDKQIKQITQLIEESWKERSAECLRAKLQVCENYRKKAEEELSMVIYYLKQISMQLEEGGNSYGY